MSNSRSNSEKRKAFWPIPGGLKNYLNTTIMILVFIEQVNPNSDLLVDWFLENFEKIKSRQNARGYVTNVVKTWGLVSVSSNDELRLTEAGKEYLKTQDTDRLFEIIDNNVIGFSEIIQAIHDGNTKLQDIHEKTTEYLEPYVRWTSTYPVKYRLDWLRVLRKVELNRGHYTLVDEKIIQDKLRKGPENIAKIETVKEKETELNEIIQELLVCEHESKNPQDYEEAISRAFEYMGFKTEHLGNSGDTDVLVIAEAGKEKFSIVVDGKTTKNNKISERQISWPTIRDHKNLHNADFSVVVAPDFAGGDMIKRAEEFSVSLIKTSDLIQLLETQEDTPLSLVDLKMVFEDSGLIDLSQKEELNKIISRHKMQNELLPKIVTQLKKLHAGNEKTSITDLYWSLNRNYSEYEISQSIDLLQKLGFIQRDERENYYSIVNNKTILRKLSALSSLFNEKSQ